MEVEVRAIGGIESCFASLPLSLIQALQSTSGGTIPSVVALELRSHSGRCWNIAWSGAASRSSAIEVDQQLAECISLPDCLKVQVKAVANLPKAALVSIEPCSEDDWEILELNAEHAEEAILKQVSIVHEGMKFPLWLHKHVVILFLVVSTSPNKPLVQLVPGTEVAVAPKRRKKRADAYQDIQKHSTMIEQSKTRALLRVQEANRRDVYRFAYKGFELGVVLTSAVFIHPETARNLSFDNHQLVTMFPRVPPDDSMQNENDISLRRGTSVTEKNNEILTSTKMAKRHTIVRIILSDAVAKGHVMIPHSLRHFLRAAVHAWVYVKKYSDQPKKDLPLFTLTPCRFKFSEKNKHNGNNGIDILESNTNLLRKRIISDQDSFYNANMRDWSHHEDFLSSFSRGIVIHGGEEENSRTLSIQLKFLVQSWLIGQLKAITSYTGQMEVRSLVLTNESLFHFEVIDCNLGKKVKDHTLTDDYSKKGIGSAESAIELLYLLKATLEESSHGNMNGSYELSLNPKHGNDDAIHDLELTLGKLELGDPISLDCDMEGSFKRNISSTLSSLSWMENATSDVIQRLHVLLSPSSGKLLSTFDLPLPGHVLIYGPPGSGKTTLTTTVAKYLEESMEILAHVVFVSCSKLALNKSQMIRQAISRYISEALVHSPSVIIFDDLDTVITFPSESEASQPSNSVVALTNFFTDIIDEYGEKSRNSCGYGPIAFMATVKSLGNLPHSLTSSGRFDFHVQLPAPAVSERGAILKHEINKRSLQCADDIVSDIASKSDGYDAYDLEILVDRTVHAAVGRFLSAPLNKELDKPILVEEDFSQAMHKFVPVAMRGLTKAASDGGRSGWEDIGGLINIRNAIQEMVELPSKFPSIFGQSPIRMRSNVLLYGPPGCGKTHIVGAAAAACSLRFISVKGPELLNKYIGASEQAVRDIFSKAAAAAPCLLFFDEFDSIAPKRGHDNTGVTDRVVNQLLTELDGVVALTGVFVFCATSRPDLLDAALLRPGRLDRLLFCDFPSRQERLDILTVLSRKLPLASDVDMEAIASMTEGFSGADLQALLSDAQLASVHELLDSGYDGTQESVPIIGGELLKSVTSKARPSVSEAEKRRLQKIYSQFFDSKKSVNAQSRDSKGKRATLA